MRYTSVVMHADAGFVSCLLGWGAAGAGSVPCAYARAEFFLLFAGFTHDFLGIRHGRSVGFAETAVA